MGRAASKWNRTRRAQADREESDVKSRADISTDRSEVAAHMADAMTYLMRVADESGFDQIMEELLKIRNKLLLISAEEEED